LEIINITSIITAAPKTATRIAISSIIIITIRMSYVLYIEDLNTAPKSIYQRNKRLRKLDLKPGISINLRLRTFINLIRSLIIAIYN
jgi:hypothetical protein